VFHVQKGFSGGYHHSMLNPFLFLFLVVSPTSKENLKTLKHNIGKIYQMQENDKKNPQRMRNESHAESARR
jgi:hypothetical protein